MSERPIHEALRPYSDGPTQPFTFEMPGLQTREIEPIAEHIRVIGMILTGEHLCTS